MNNNMMWNKKLLLDIVDFRLQRAKEMGADYTLKITKDMAEDSVVQKIKELLGEDPDISLDCSGAEQSVRVALLVNISERGDIDSKLFCFVRLQEPGGP